MKNTYYIFLLFFFFFFACIEKENQKTAFISVENGTLIKNGEPYYFVGANFWYGAILASEGEGGNRNRLHKELDQLKSLGVDNLRILIGSDGECGVKYKVEPTLQLAPGIYNDTILDGLDYLLSELYQRDMSAVLYFNNSWEWSGGYGQYLEWAGYGKAPLPLEDGWDTYMNHVSQFHQCDTCKVLFADYVKDIISRTNRYTGKLYKEDPAIMSWQIGNEPRAFSEDNKQLFAYWIHDVAKQIRSLDPNHLISVGSEGSQGCEGDIELWDLIHSYPEIDYMTIHIWPYNWGWADKNDLASTIEYSKEQSGKYIQAHLERAKKHNKPLVIEEFGFIRDNFSFQKGSPTTYRDQYYKYIFDFVTNNSEDKRYLAGCNIWAWGGAANQNPEHVFWQKGDDYTGDPAQEEQGLYSVFDTDSSTLQVIKDAIKELPKSKN